MIRVICISFFCFLTACCVSKKAPKAHDSSQKIEDSQMLPVQQQEAVDQTIVLFDFDKDSLTEEAKLMLDHQISYIKNNIHDKLKYIVVEGHCDTRGSHEYNMGLGNRRAARVQEYIRKQGIDLDIQIVSYGKTRPLDDGTDQYAHSRNRRAVTTIE